MTQAEALEAASLLNMRKKLVGCSAAGFVVEIKTKEDWRFGCAKSEHKYNMVQALKTAVAVVETIMESEAGRGIEKIDKRLRELGVVYDED